MKQLQMHDRLDGGVAADKGQIDGVAADTEQT